MSSLRLMSLLTLVTTFLLSGCDLVLPPTGLAPTREDIVTEFPNVEEGSSQAANEKILCPFQRMLDRAGIYGDASPNPSINEVKEASKVFGCAKNSCGVVANLVGFEQSGLGVDLERLHEAGSSSHDCGLTFALGGSAVSDAVRSATLDRLLQLADNDGSLVYADLLEVKTEICTAQNVAMSKAGEIEVKLIFAYLGGVENGSVSHSDVERLLNATMPEIKTHQWITAELLDQIN